MKKLQDLDPMPWGKHEKTPMQDVPASYFHYLWFHGKKSEVKTCPVADYIQRNIHAFQKENRDLIWD